MSGLDNMKTRIEFRGGASQEARMQADKLHGLRKAINYSYQSETIEIGEKKFKCLINPDKITADYECKKISIPHDAIDLNTNKNEKTNLKQGDVFHWVETDTDWLVYLQKIEETAYFRADIRKCQHEVEINGHKYKVYTRGPIENTLTWKQTEGNYYNTLNYTSIMYITKNEETLEFFERFAKIKLDGDTWEVQATDKTSVEGIIEVALKESFNNTIEDEIMEETAETEVPGSDEAGLPRIVGARTCYPYDTLIYKVEGLTGGSWSIDNSKIVKINSQNELEVKLSIVTGRSNSFTLSYQTTEQTLNMPIEILSL